MSVSLHPLVSLSLSLSVATFKVVPASKFKAQDTLTAFKKKLRLVRDTALCMCADLWVYSERKLVCNSSAMVIPYTHLQV